LQLQASLVRLSSAVGKSHKHSVAVLGVFIEGTGQTNKVGLINLLGELISKFQTELHQSNEYMSQQIKSH